MKKLAAPAIAIVCSIISAIYFDQWLSQTFDLIHEKAGILRVIAHDITDIGKTEQWFALAILVYFGCWLMKRMGSKMLSPEKQENLKNWSVHLFSALVASGLLLHVVKIGFGRQRPYKTLDHEALVFHPFTMDWDFGSFPSGHTQTLFCLSTLLVLLWPKQAKWIWVVTAIFAFTRVVAIQHFFSDVIGGALIGIYGAKLSMSLISRKFPLPKAL